MSKYFSWQTHIFTEHRFALPVAQDSKADLTKINYLRVHCLFSHAQNVGFVQCYLVKSDHYFKLQFMIFI